jgi:hypothetical protein
LSEDFPAFMDFFGLSFLGPAHEEGEHDDHEGHGGHDTPGTEPAPAIASVDPL